MSPRAVQTLFDDPLAGCDPIFTDPGPATTMLRSLLMRLRVYLEEERSTSLGDQIIAEAKALPVPRYEYVINEVQHELRRCTREYDEAFEAVVLSNWVKDLLKRIPEDDVWQFHKGLRENRERRKR